MKIVSLDELYTWLPLPQEAAKEDLEGEQARNAARVSQGHEPLSSQYAEISDELYEKLEQGLRLIGEVGDAVEGTEENDGKALPESSQPVDVVEQTRP